MRRLKEEFNAVIFKEEYSGWNGWVTEYYVDVEGREDFEDIKKKFVDKKVKITIEVVDE